MKLDELINRDSMTINTDEWSCHIALGPMNGGVGATLVEAYGLSSGSVFLRFEYRAPQDYTFIGYMITRAWVQPDGTMYVRIVRSDSWTPAYVAKAGSLVEVEVVINPEDWA